MLVRIYMDGFRDGDFSKVLVVGAGIKNDGKTERVVKEKDDFQVSVWKGYPLMNIYISTVSAILSTPMDVEISMFQDKFKEIPIYLTLDLYLL